MKILRYLPLLLSACSPSQGYEGPALPTDQVATIASYSQAGLERDALFVDYRSVSYFSTGISVLPGTHELRMDFSESDKACDADEWYGPCYRQWSCAGTLECSAGKEYKLKAVPGAVWIFEGSDDTPIGSLSCEDTNS